MYVSIYKPTLFLFTDASVDPLTKVGYGAYLLLGEYELEAPLPKLKINIKKFKNTTSSRLELETLLWALQSIKATGHKIVAFTDSQNIITLKDREDRIKKNKYLGKSGIHLRNHKLYKKFYALTDMYECDFIKVKGHKKSEDKDRVDEYFTLVDRASRDALRSR